MKLRLLRCFRQAKPEHHQQHRDSASSLQSNQLQKHQSKQKHQQQNGQHAHIHNKYSDETIKILLLGTAESGKSTIIKQMRILHINGYTDVERRDLIPEIYQNIHDSIFQLVQQMRILGLEYKSCTSHNSAEYILNVGPIAPVHMSEEYCDHIMTLWNDIGIRTCFDRSSEFPLLDSAKYFLDNFERISGDEYIPTTEDILHSRNSTTGITSVSFRVSIPKSLGGGEQEFRMFDVGGQRDQRNKWIQVFEGIHVVLFLISCADFDQTLREDSRQNRLQEALNLFRGVWQNRFLAAAGLIVFLNKQDIMERKIRAGKHIADYFPEYEEFRRSPQLSSMFDECDWTKEFIKQKLVDITHEEPIKRSTRHHMAMDYIRRECYYHFTVATDTNCIKKVFNDVYKMILHENTSAYELM